MNAAVKKPVPEFIKSTLVGGALVILPFGLMAVLVMKLLDMIKPLAVPIVELLPVGWHFHRVVAAMLVILFCFTAGLLAQTRVGQGIGASFERTILDRIPGYSILRSFTRRIGDVEESEKFAPALAEIEDSLVPAFVVEKLADGQLTVFVPSAPTPAVGTIYIMTEDRVHFVDVPFLKVVKCVSRWGAGSAELVKAIRTPERSQK